MSLEDFDLPPRVAHARDEDAARPEWVRMALRQREAERAEAKRNADELAAIEEHEMSGGMWEGVFAAMPAWMRDVSYPVRTGVDSRLFGP